MRLLTALASAVLLLAAAPAAAQQHRHGPPRPDSDAPPGSAPHWIPKEQWVLNHWLPYDEARLTALLGTTRDGLWRQLRDDRRTLAQMAARRGWTAHRLAVALVAPRRVGARQRRMLVERAHRTLTQGHMAQHVLFHTLHQEVLPQNAQRLFGMPHTTFRRLRRMDLAPLEIARMAGRTRVQVERDAAHVLRRTALSGVRRGETTRRQAALLLDRQLHQLPRWLEHPRYNGPPPTDEHGKLLEPLRAHALRPALAPDGSWVAFEQAQPAVPMAVTEGEIAVQVRRLDGTPLLAPAVPTAAAPCSAYGAATAGPQAVAFELLAGNGTFAKRYGEPAIARADLATGAVQVVSPARWTAYRPSAGGDAVAFQAVRPSGSPSQVAVWRAGRLEVLPGVRREPALSGDGRVLATVVAKGVQVRAGGTERLIRARDAHEPVLDAAGRTLAFSAAGPRVVVVDLTTGRRRTFGRGTHQPALSPDGATLAFAHRTGGPRTPAGRPAQRLLAAELGAGAPPAVLATGGYNAHPSLAAGGRKVAYTNEGATRTQRVLVLDRDSGRTTQLDGTPGLVGALTAPCRAAAPAW